MRDLIHNQKLFHMAEGAGPAPAANDDARNPARRTGTPPSLHRDMYASMYTP